MGETGGRNDPFLAFRFEIRISGLPAGGFSECGGIQLETETQDYPEGGLNTHILKFPTRTKQSNIVLKRGIAGRILWDWYFALTLGLIQRLPGSIIVKDPAGGQDVMEWQFLSAFPSKWTGPELNASQNNVAIETLELCHHGLLRTR